MKGGGKKKGAWGEGGAQGSGLLTNVSTYTGCSVLFIQARWSALVALSVVGRWVNS